MQIKPACCKLWSCSQQTGVFAFLLAWSVLVLTFFATTIGSIHECCKSPKGWWGVLHLNLLLLFLNNSASLCSSYSGINSTEFDGTCSQLNAKRLATLQGVFVGGSHVCIGFYASCLQGVLSTLTDKSRHSCLLKEDSELCCWVCVGIGR